MTQRGFALLATLWVLTALTAMAGVALGVARIGSQATRNRILLARAGWAREACVEILLARYAQDTRVREVPVTDLGRGTWCRARLEDPGAKLNVNEASEAMLSGAVGSLLPDLMERRRLGPLTDIAEVPGLERYADILTTRGTGVVSINAAPAKVLRVVPGLSEEAVRLIVERRASGRLLQSADELAGTLSSPGRRVLLAQYMEFIRAATFVPPQLVAVVEGGVSGTPIVARATLTVVPVPERLAVIRREVE